MVFNGQGKEIDWAGSQKVDWLTGWLNKKCGQVVGPWPSAPLSPYGIRVTLQDVGPIRASPTWDRLWSYGNHYLLSLNSSYDYVDRVQTRGGGG